MQILELEPFPWSFWCFSMEEICREINLRGLGLGEYFWFLSLSLVNGWKRRKTLFKFYHLIYPKHPTLIGLKSKKLNLPSLKELVQVHEPHGPPWPVVLVVRIEAIASSSLPIPTITKSCSRSPIPLIKFTTAHYGARCFGQYLP